MLAFLGTPGFVDRRDAGVVQGRQGLALALEVADVLLGLVHDPLATLAE